MPKNEVIDRDLGWNAIKANMKKAKGLEVVVGILAPADSREGWSPIGNVKLGLVHEFGRLDGTIPSRSFLRSTFDVNQNQYRALIRKVAGNMITRKWKIERALGIVGAKVKADIQNRISQGIPPKLSLETIQKKQSSKPLIDTGQLKNSITWKVRRRTIGALVVR